MPFSTNTSPKVDTKFAASEPESWTPALAGFAETLREAVVDAGP